MSTIDQVKQKIEIVELVSGYNVALKKAGRNFTALCPFHAEKTPSFFVFPDKQSWHCFGACATGGDIFSFVMKKENMDFGEALRMLAGRAGVEVVSREQSGITRKIEDRIKEINAMAAQYYSNLLLNSTKAEFVRNYLTKRGITLKSTIDFGLGYSLNEWESAKIYLIDKGCQEKELVEAGILIRKDDGSSHDRFRNRLMFPIRDVRGQATGFGARVLDDSLPKYLNSPQTPAFDKSASLYGIDLAGQAIRRSNLAVIVEGYFDVIMAHQYGYCNVVANMGTALTTKQIDMLKSLTKKFVLALDADAAGELATLRSLETSWHARDIDGAGKTLSLANFHSRWPDAQIMIMSMPRGKDPDEIIRENPGQWQKLANEAPSWIDFVFNTITSKVDLEKLSDKSQAIDKILPFIASLIEPVEQAYYIQKLSRMTQIDEKTLIATLKKIKKETLKQPKYSGETPGGRSSPVPRNDPLEEYLLYLLIKYPDLRQGCINELKGEHFNSSENKELYFIVMSQIAAGKEEIRATLDTFLKESFEHISGKAVPPLNDEERKIAVSECVRNLRTRWLRSLKLKEELLLRKVADEGDVDESKNIQQNALGVNRELNRIFKEEAPKSAS